MAQARNKSQTVARLPPDVSRILYVKSLPFKITEDELYDLFGRYGAIRQIRLGSTAETRGRAYVVYEDIYDAKNALEKLTGFNVLGRYLIVLYHNPANDKAGSDKTKSAAIPTKSAAAQRNEVAKKKIELENLKSKFGVKGMEE